MGPIMEINRVLLYWTRACITLGTRSSGRFVVGKNLSGFGKPGYVWGSEWNVWDAMKWRWSETEQSLGGIKMSFALYSNGKF